MEEKTQPKALLTWTFENHERMHHVRGPETMIGRGEGCHLMLEDRTVSRTHARITFDGGQYKIEDLGSSRGTMVNGEVLKPLEDRPVLHHEDEISFGKLRARFQLIPPDRDGPVSNDTIRLNDNVSQQALELEIQKFRQSVHRHLTEISSNQPGIEGLGVSFNQELEKFSGYITARFKEHIVLHEITQIIGQILDIRELLGTALKLVIKVLGVDRGFILLWDEGQKQLKTMVTHRFDPNSGQTHQYDLNFSHTVANTCFEKKEIIMIQDAMKDELFRSAYSIIASSIRSVVCIPLLHGNEINGVIYLDDLHTPGVFQPHQEQFLLTFAKQTVIALENAKLYTRAVTDDLTKLYNRKYIQKRISEEMDRARRYDRLCSLIMLDIDHFKKINDTHGHLIGDMVLEQTAELLQTTVRATDIVARFGGEEFLILLPETPLDGAREFAERLRGILAKRVFQKGDHMLHITASFGVVAYKEDFKTNVGMFVDEGDKALYQAKREGRNRVVCSL